MKKIEQASTGKKIKMKLNSGERLEDLQRDNLFIIQSEDNYRFSIDSVLLSDFARLKSTDKVVELCSGSGVVSILANAKYKPLSILGIEIDDALYDMSKRTLEYNKINSISFVNDDIKNALKYVKQGQIDAVISNPPYYKLKDKGENVKDLVAKYEVKTTLNEVLSIASQLLKNKGRLYLSYPVQRIQELMRLASQLNLVCKEIEFNFNLKKDAKFMLVKFVKNAKEGVKVTSNFLHESTE